MNDLITDELIGALSAHTSTEPLHILELGSGTGTTALQLLALLKERNIYTPIHLHLVDNNPLQMQAAQEKLDTYISDLLSLHYHTGDIFDFFKHLPHQVDIIYSMFTLHNFAPMPRSEIIQAISMSMKSWALLINADKIAHNNRNHHQSYYNKTLKWFKVFQSQDRQDLYNEWIGHYIKDEEIKRTEQEYLDLLASHNLYTHRDHGRFLMEKVIVSKKQRE
jgi:ubiquinone/menaquinone biosynthesis C-methylase UbiE